eukprot:SAG31_NODE_4600_length_3104_cov_2.174709_1_plen_106_part_00
MHRAAQLRKWLKMSDQMGGVQISFVEFGYLSVTAVAGFVSFGGVLMWISVPKFAEKKSLPPPSEAYKICQRAALLNMRAAADARTPQENLDHAVQAWQKMHGFKE